MHVGVWAFAACLRKMGVFLCSTLIIQRKEKMRHLQTTKTLLNLSTHAVLSEFDCLWINSAVSNDVISGQSDQPARIPDVISRV